MTYDDGDPGPYPYPTRQNTSGDWLSDFTPVSANLDSMIDYAKALEIASQNLQAHQMRAIEEINDISMAGAFAGGFPEITYAGTLHAQNLSQFSQYLQQLYDGLYHSANAAKAIADTYGDSDTFAAISMDAVEFAFGSTDVPRPSGLPPGIATQTFSQMEAEQKGPDGKKQKEPSIWTAGATTQTMVGGACAPDGSTIYQSIVTVETFTDQYGHARTITITQYPDGSQKTSIVDPTGTTSSSSSTRALDYPPYTSTTTTTTTTPDGKTSTSTSTISGSPDGTTTDETEGGKLKTETVVKVNSDGSETTSVYTVDDHGKKTLSEQYTVGYDNPVDNGVPDSPADDAIQYWTGQ